MEPFFDAFVTVAEWQKRQPEGCPSASCAFVQMHGKGPNTCRFDQVFLSVGMSESSWQA